MTSETVSTSASILQQLSQIPIGSIIAFFTAMLNPRRRVCALRQRIVAVAAVLGLSTRPAMSATTSRTTRLGVVQPASSK